VGIAIAAGVVAVGGAIAGSMRTLSAIAFVYCSRTDTTLCFLVGRFPVLVAGGDGFTVSATASGLICCEIRFWALRFACLGVRVVVGTTTSSSSRNSSSSSSSSSSSKLISILFALLVNRGLLTVLRGLMIEESTLSGCRLLPNLDHLYDWPLVACAYRSLILPSDLVMVLDRLVVLVRLVFSLLPLISCAAVVALPKIRMEEPTEMLAV
jgi:hypothetical protein